MSAGRHTQLVLLCRLLPGVEKVARAAADPELRDVASSALAILERVSKEAEEQAAQPEQVKADPAVRSTRRLVQPAARCWSNNRARIKMMRNCVAYWNCHCSAASQLPSVPVMKAQQLPWGMKPAAASLLWPGLACS